MKFLLVLFALPLGTVAFWLLRRRYIEFRRARLRAQPLPADILTVLQTNVGIYSLLPDSLQQELHGHTQVFLNEKSFVGCDGFEITDEVRFTVAGIASILLLNREARYFPGFTTILMYPDSYVSTEVSYDGHMEVHREVTRAGESWHRGPIVLSWKDVVRGTAHAGDGYNVVLHEFAHKLDEESGSTNGAPILNDTQDYDDWSKVLGEEFKSLEGRARRGKNRVLHEYGLTSPAEFFAVATESFFEKPKQMKDRLPDLYQQLSKFYCLDPASWKGQL